MTGWICERCGGASEQMLEAMPMSSIARLREAAALGETPNTRQCARCCQIYARPANAIRALSASLKDALKVMQRAPQVPAPAALRDARLSLESTIDRVKQARDEGVIASPSTGDWTEYELRLRAVASFLESLETWQP